MSITLYTRNILETGTVTVTGTPDTGYPEARLHDRAVSLYWKDTVTEAKDFTVDQGASGNLAVDFLAVFRHNFSGIAMQWQYSNDDFSADVNDAVTDWTQGDNNAIVKVMGSAETQRYWRVTLASMANPKCGEIFMSFGRSFDVMQSPASVAGENDNVRWHRSVGGLERSTKLGEAVRHRQYTLFLSASELTSFQAAMAELDEYSRPFWIKDDAGAYFPCRLLAPPAEIGDHKTHAHLRIEVVEML